jgi:MFS family permease
VTGRAASTGVLPGTMAVLTASVLTVSIGYGVILPLLPNLIERLLGAGGDAAQISRSTGLLTGLYSLSLFLFAPAWGRLSDRYVAWFTANWFWVLVFFAFIAMHMFGHGGHGGHSGHGGGDRQRSRDERERDEAQGRVVNTSSGGHQH